jgi:stage V sporulation protein AA
MDIYIKPNKMVKVYKTGKLYIKDIADVSTEGDLKKRVDNLCIYNIKTDTVKSYLISIIDIITVINNALPGHTINNVGETDIVVEFSKDKSQNNIWKYLKICFVSIVLLAGSATAIMSFHSDAQMATVFENYYYIFFNEKIENPMIINLPYSIGLSLGIVVFFNHFSSKKLTSDPTPIEVEMSSYEQQVTDSIIDTLNQEKNNDN